MKALSNAGWEYGVNSLDQRVTLLEEGGGSGSVTWTTLSGKPAVIAAGADQAAARTVIGAGTSNLSIGTTASTAKAGNWVPVEADIPSLPASKINSGTFAIARIPTGTTASTVSLGNHTHTGAQIALTGYAAGTAGNVAAADTINAAIAKLEARIVALETA